ncbi:DNA-binding Xre family transcriptional regulator [Streptomyces tendae]|uniref:helix-turn-helix domain-containing protein n=1 Tax=Streptomyces TaxID=1883 RepID=UPI0038373B4B
MKWNLRWAAAKCDIWRPVDLQAAFATVGFTPSLSKVAALWGGTPVTVRLDDLDKICAALQCTVADLMEAEPVAPAEGLEEPQRAVGGEAGAVRLVPRRDGRRQLRPPN